ncbi:putative fasciclin-like arabinogalactan protein 17-like isoform 1 [Capsicum annuum]|nr:putative fasciclin-like arabinogalactan protein 17-like isoform 1 [Capsicum annuum]KAF3633070.1 putative fasciclin-like arabinogalactan protein 17-like isoform 1 [Capsicum annuum]
MSMVYGLLKRRIKFTRDDKDLKEGKKKMDEIWIYCGMLVCFRLKEFAIVTGLRCDRPEEPLIKDTPHKRSNKHKENKMGHWALLELPMDIDDAELEECILQHLVVATSMGRAHHMGQRDGSRNSLSTNERPYFLVFSTHHNSSPTTSVSPSPTRSIIDSAAATIVDSSLPISSHSSESPRHMPHLLLVQCNKLSALSSGSILMLATTQEISIDASSARREADAGIAGLSHLMECLKTQENSRAGSVPAELP